MAYETQPQDILSVAEMYAADQAAVAAGVSSLALMETAGAAISREIIKRWPRQLVAIFCGPGNNGGDGFVVARHLMQAGWPTKLALMGDVLALKGDAAFYAARWQDVGGTTESLDAQSIEALLLQRPLVVDALFGAGLNRGLSGTAALAIQRVTELELTCIAVDVPSGLHGDTGFILPDTNQPGKAGLAANCALTVTFFRLKPAHVLYPGRALCGEVVVANIGIPDAVLNVIKPRLVLNDPRLWSLLHPDWQSHKYTRGHAIVFGGAKMNGAGRLAGFAARRVGAGLLTYAIPGRALNTYGADQPGALLHGVDSSHDLDELLSDHRKNAILIGPGYGVGPATCSLVLRLLNTARAVVLDADALTSFSADPHLLFDAIKSRAAPTVLTPHEGEFARLFGVNGPKIERATAAATLSGAVVVLKGADTLIAAPDGRIAINTNGSPWLATGGSGDVLAGLVVGLLAQGMTAWHAANAAVWLHGAAGAKVGPGLIAEDLPSAVVEVIKNI